MNRFEIFSNLIDKTADLADDIHTYNIKPRVYGANVEMFRREAHYLRLIAELKTTTVSQLVEITGKTKGGISQIILKLEKKGLILRERSNSNYKEINLSLSEKGNIVNDGHTNYDREIYEIALSRLDHFSNEDFEKYAELLNILKELNKINLEKY